MRSRIIVLTVAAVAACAGLAPAVRADWYGGPPPWAYNRPPPPWGFHRNHPYAAYGYDRGYYGARPMRPRFYLGRPPMINRPPEQQYYYGD